MNLDMNLVARYTLRAAALLLLPAVYGCGALQQGLNNLNDSAVAADSAEATSQTAALAYLAVDPLAGAMAPATAQEAAAKAAAGAKVAFSGSACVTAVVDADPTRVIYTLTSCTGPFGLVRTSGKVTATYTKNGSQFTVALASVEPLKIGGAQLTLAATVTTTDLANTRSVNVTTTSSAVGQLGRTLAHAGSFNAAWDQNQCLTLNGSFTTTENNTQSSTLIADYSRCKNLCPQKGTFTLTTASLTGARVIQVTFGGAATANFTVSGPGGQSSGTVALSCGT